MASDKMLHYMILPPKSIKLHAMLSVLSHWELEGKTGQCLMSAQQATLAKGKAHLRTPFPVFGTMETTYYLPSYNSGAGTVRSQSRKVVAAYRRR
jgi:hypothetical protein